MKHITDDPGRRPLRALINNAGIEVNAPVEVLPLSEWRRIFDVNLFGHVAMTQALLPALIESRGTVVNISSVGGKVAMANYGPLRQLEVRPRSGQRCIAPRGRAAWSEGHRG